MKISHIWTALAPYWSTITGSLASILTLEVSFIPYQIAPVPHILNSAGHCWCATSILSKSLVFIIFRIFYNYPTVFYHISRIATHICHTFSWHWTYLVMQITPIHKTKFKWNIFILAHMTPLNYSFLFDTTLAIG